jgi:hypothetical protein
MLTNIKLGRKVNSHVKSTNILLEGVSYSCKNIYELFQVQNFEEEKKGTIAFNELFNFSIYHL